MNWSFRTGNWLFVQKVSHTDVFHQVYTSATGSDRFETNREIISKVEKNFCCFLYEKRIWKRMKKKFLIWVHDCNFFFKWEERQMVHHPSSFRDGPYCHFLHFTVSPLYLFLFLFLSGCCLAHLRAPVCVCLVCRVRSYFLHSLQLNEGRPEWRFDSSSAGWPNTQRRLAHSSANVQPPISKRKG